MTIGAWVLFIALALLIIVGMIGIIADHDLGKSGVAITIGIGLILIGGLLGFLLWKFNCTESGKRAMKTQQSNLSGGIERKVTVFDIKGDIVAEYEGKFDVDYDSDRIIFDDENGKRHIIYYKTATVVIDEV